MVACGRLCAPIESLALLYSNPFLSKPLRKQASRYYLVSCGLFASPPLRFLDPRAVPYPPACGAKDETAAPRRDWISMKTLIRETAAGVTPGIRDAWPKVRGRIR